MKKKVYEKIGRLCSATQTGKQGSSLIELLVAVVIISIMSVAIYGAGFAVLRQSQSVTILTAAHMYAKEGLEEKIAAGYENLTGGAPVAQKTMVNPNTHHVTLVRTETIIWHAPDGSTSGVPLAQGYAEVIVRVVWQVPRTTRTGSVALSTLVFYCPHWFSSEEI